MKALAWKTIWKIFHN